MRLVALLSVLLSFSTYASIPQVSQIYDVDYGKPGEEILVLLVSGQVIRIKENKADFIQRFEAAKKKRLTLFQSQQEPYTPTVIESLEQLNAYFHEAKYVDKESQCYNRAHIWSYEWFNKHAINSNKTWLFFTRRYIRKFKFDWWFHVSPSMRVMEDGVEREKIMDVKYGRSPLTLKNWTNIFMRDDADCPVVNTYSEYANYPESGSCFVMRTSMFHYQPVDIESHEIWGTIKNSWYEIEIKQAYLEAFDEVL